MKIGNVELKNNLILAPMAGVTDLPFRLIVEKFNPGLVCTEMVSSKALFYGDEKTKQLLKTDGEKRQTDRRKRERGRRNSFHQIFFQTLFTQERRQGLYFAFAPFFKRIHHYL